MAKCNHNCLSCTFSDCIVDDEPTVTEITESMQRDANYTNYGRVVHGKVKAKLDKGRRY